MAGSNERFSRRGDRSLRWRARPGQSIFITGPAPFAAGEMFAQMPRWAMRLPGWPMITRLTVRRRLSGGLALVWMVSFMAIFFEVSDGRISQWMVEVDLFSLEENRAASEPSLAADRRVLIEQRESQGISQGSREVDSTTAYLQQFEQPGLTEWLPHSY